MAEDLGLKSYDCGNEIVECQDNSFLFFFLLLIALFNGSGMFCDTNDNSLLFFLLLLIIIMGGVNLF